MFYRRVIIIILISISLQGVNLSQIEITYNLVLSLNQISMPREATLLADDTSSIFYHSRGTGIITHGYHGEVGDENLEVNTNDIPRGSNAMDMYKLDEFGNNIYTLWNQNAMRVREIIMFDSFIYDEPSIPQISWIMGAGKKDIANFKCFEASCIFRGRQYHVWYSPQLPARLGPWKLTGLPGTILEASEQTGIFKVAAKNINFKTKLNVVEQTNYAKWTGRLINFTEAKIIHLKTLIKFRRLYNPGGENNIDKDQADKFLEIFIPD